MNNEVPFRLTDFHPEIATMQRCDIEKSRAVGKKKRHFSFLARSVIYVADFGGTSLRRLGAGLLLVFAFAAQASVPAPIDNWNQAVRSSPYWISQGVYDNLVTIRSWVLKQKSFCEDKQRHLLFDRRATFLGYVPDAETTEKTQALLNAYRAQLASNGKVDHWTPGKNGQAGYPFALSCDQPDAELGGALSRYMGVDESARLWGTWDGMRIGTSDKTVSLHEALLQVFHNRKQLGRVSMPEDTLSTIAGKVLIESGGRARAHSSADARGIMQLSKAALKDCGLNERFHFHRMAQIDCALRLLDQNHRVLQPAFEQRFGHLPSKKAKELYALLLLQAYHGGVGLVSKLLNDPQLGKAAEYFAEHHQRFSAGDIALGLVFHNMGRDKLGFASLYYVVDVGIATREACTATTDLPGC